MAKGIQVVVAVPDAVRARRMVEVARMLKPDIESVARVHTEQEVALLQHEKGGEVFMGEHELALAMTRHVLDDAGPGRRPGCNSYALRIE